MLYILRALIRKLPGAVIKAIPLPEPETVTGFASRGKEGELCTFDSSGEILGCIRVDRDISSIDLRGGEVLVLYEDEMTLYSADFSDSISYQHVSNGRKALLSGPGQVMLLGSHGAEVIRFPVN